MQDVVTAVDERFGAPGAKKRIPVVLTRTEVQTVLGSGKKQLPGIGMFLAAWDDQDC